MTIDEKLALYKTVIGELQKQHDLTKMIEELPMEYQVEVLRFLKFFEGH